ncbi:MAG: hypothetical protein AAF449_12905 [Myxococcota bacterium]
MNFRGYWVAPGAVVQILASSSPGGPFSQIGSAVTQTNGYEYPDGLTVYFFETAVTVPEQYWTGDACTGQQTYLRAANTSGLTVPSLDETAPNGQDSYTCIQERVSDGWSTIGAITFCDSPDSPNIRLYTAASTGPSSFSGNVTIATAADEKYWSCLQTLQGNLTVPGLGPDNVSLPRLQQVNGNISVTYDRFSLSSGDEGSYTFDVPALTTINGDFIANSPPISASTIFETGRVVLGLNAVTTLTGDLRLQVDAGNISVNGLSALSTLGGDLILNGGTGDAMMNNFASNLVQIGGDLEVDVGNNVQQMLLSLQNIQGSFRHLDGNPYASGSTSDSYRSLQSIGTNLLLQTGVIQGPGGLALMPNLTSIGGNLTYRQMSGQTSVLVGSTNLSAGGLAVENNTALTQLGASNLTLLPAAAVQVTNNPNLCTSSITTFVSSQTGWAGTLTQFNNDTGC